MNYNTIKKRLGIKKKPNWLLIIAILVVGVIALRSCDIFSNDSDDSLFLPDEENTGGDSSDDFSGGGSGGGSSGGSSSSDNAIPEGGFTCEDCDAIFLEGNPGIIENSFSTTPLRYRLPFVKKPAGHWNCQGTCTYNGQVVDGYNCVIDPVSEIPENGFDDITGEKPSCWCLPESPGPCNFFDANYGEGIDNLQCGGSCPEGQECVYWISPGNEKEHCECRYDQTPGPVCGFHFPEGYDQQNAKSYEELEQYCYGSCQEDSLGITDKECTFDVDITSGVATCECKSPNEVPEDKIPCTNVDTKDGSEWWKCWTEGSCESDNECIYDQYTKSCMCQDPDDCGWHISEQQAIELHDQFGNNLPMIYEYILDHINYYCYGYCQEEGECHYEQFQTTDMRVIHDCTCKQQEDYYPDLDPNLEGLGDSYISR